MGAVELFVLWADLEIQTCSRDGHANDPAGREPPGGHNRDGTSPAQAFALQLAVPHRESGTTFGTADGS